MPHPVRFALILALLAFPLLEIAVLIKAGSAFGFWPVVLFVVATAVAGSFIVRQHGLSVFGRIFAAAEEGKNSLEPLLDTLLAVTAGLLLFLPGLIGDALGVILLIPLVRRAIVASGLSRLLAGAVVRTEVHEERRRPPPNDPEIIEVDYERIEERTVEPGTGQPKQK